MSPSKLHPFSILLIFAATLIFSSCAVLMPEKTREKDPRAVRLAQRVKSINHELETSKGTAWAILTNGNTRHRFKIAWACLVPDKIRLTILESGIPIETILADGRKVVFISHTGKHSIHTIKAPNPSLEPMVEMPVRIREIISLLAGKIPMESFDTEWISTSEGSDSTTLTLSKKWRGTIGHVQFDEKEEIFQFQPMGRDGEPIYSVSISDLETHGKYTIPHTTLITDNSGRILTLKIISFYPDLPIKASVFALTETE